MRRLAIACVVSGLLCSMASAGVVVETEVVDADSPGTSDTETFYAQGEMVRMDPPSVHGGDDMSMIFKDQTMWFVNHDKKVCQKIDKKGMTELSAQLDEMMKQLEQIPPGQRAMMEKMMKGKMPGMEPPPSWRVEVGADEQVGSYSCTVHTLYADEDKVSEICSADESVADDIKEAMDAFHAMSRFTADLQKVVQQGPFMAMIGTAYSQVSEIGGFPIRTRTFDGEGQLVRESTLKSITRQDVDEAVFAVPKGYKVKDLANEIKKGR